MSEFAPPMMLSGPKALTARPLFRAVVAGVIATTIYAATFGDPTPFNHYVLLADAFLHGRLDIGNAPLYIEKTIFHGKQYVIPPPFPALLLMPYVAVRGTQANQSVASYLVGGIAAALIVLLASRLMVRGSDAAWLGVLAAFGTIVWYLSAAGSTWYFAHVVVVAVLTVGLLESVGQRRPLIMGTALGLAYLTRQTSVMVFPYFLLATMPQWAPRGLRALRGIDLNYLNRLFGPLAVAIVLYGLYNWLRFGTIADVANAWRPGILDEPWFSLGLFNPRYIPRHVAVLFAKLPAVVSHPPYLLVPWTGLAIWVTTPAFVYALRAPLTLETAAGWLGILAASSVIFMYGNPGVSQFGYRFATDFYPLLILLTMRGMGTRLSAPAKVLIALSVLVNLWGVVWMRLGWVAP
jgi:hypothetical protein